MTIEISGDTEVDDKPQNAGARGLATCPTQEQQHYLAVLNFLRIKKRGLEIAIAAITQLIADTEPTEAAPSDPRTCSSPDRALQLTEAVGNVLDEIERQDRNARSQRKLSAHGHGTGASNLDVLTFQALACLSEARTVVKICGKSVGATKASERDAIPFANDMA